MKLLMNNERANSGISGVILAGGDARRFNGIIKSKIVIGGRTIISRILETFDDIFDKILIVTIKREEFSEFSRAQIVEDQFLFKGPLGGIHAALSVSETNEVFVVAGDMPLLDPRLIQKMIDFYFNNKCDILIPVHDKYLEPLHGIYSKSMLGILENYLDNDNDYSMREFFRKCNVQYYQADHEDRRAFININSPLDLEDVEKLLFT